MILGIGIDIVKFERVQRIYAEYGICFNKRVLTQREQEIIPIKSRDEFLAGRFAAKEAVIKALGVRNISPADIEILNDENGRPFVSNLQTLLGKAGISQSAHILVSISHERDSAVGLALLESL
jgi:holo-[acyl-carrier protein] synthase